jgi:hypothetical protein
MIRNSGFAGDENMCRRRVCRAIALAVLCGILFVCGCGGFGGTVAEKDEVYLFSSFRGEREGLYLAWSEDLLSWSEIPGPHLKPTIGDKVMRDPFIMMGPDGVIHMVWTTGWRRRDIGYANTRDFVTWSEQELIPVMASKAAARNCWAPKIFYDAKLGQWQIIWSTWVDDGSFGAPELPHTSKQHRIWYATTKDFKDFVGPKVLLDPGYSCIDAFLLKGEREYLLFFKDERYNDSEVVTPAHQNIRIARSKSRYGPFGSVSQPITGSGAGKWHNEGACAVKKDGEFYVFYDHHSDDTYYGAVKSKDSKDWVDISEQLDVPKGLKHGSIIRVPRDIVSRLVAIKKVEESGK